MEYIEENYPEKRTLPALIGICALLFLLFIVGFLGWFIGRADVKDSKAVAHQLRKAQEKETSWREERAILLAELEIAKSGGFEKEETDVDRLLARKEEEWKLKLNEVRIESEIAKVKRVEELEKELRLAKIDQRMKEEMMEGDDSEVPDDLAQGLTPRARLVCSKLLEWEGLDPEIFKVAKKQLRLELGARPLTRIKFTKGSAFLSSSDKDKIRVSIADSEDYSLLLAVGFADPGGDEELNREIGSLRAHHTADALQAVTRRGQLVEAVYLGETERFGKKEENRTVEIWELRR